MVALLIASFAVEAAAIEAMAACEVNEPRPSTSTMTPTPPAATAPPAADPAPAWQAPNAHFSFTNTAGTMQEANIAADGDDKDEFDEAMEGV